MEKRFYFIVQWSLVFVFLLIAFIPIPASLTTWIQSQASNWQNISYLQLTLLLAGIGIAIQTYIHQFHKKYDANSLAHDVLITVLIAYVSIAIVLLWKYLAGVMPELGTGQNIFLYTVLSDSTADLFSKANMFQPPFLMPMYGPLYFGTARWLMNLTGQSILAFRVMTVVALLVICLALKGIASKYATGYLEWVTPAVFLAVFPLVVWSGPPTKPEYLAAQWSICGVLVYCRFGFTSNRWWVLASGLMFALALLTKISIAVGLIAILVHLLVRRKFYELFGLLLVSFGVLLLVYYWIDSATGGGIFLFNILGNAARIEVWRIINIGILQYLNDPFTIIVSASVFLLFTLEKSLQGLAGLTGIAFLIALVLFIFSWGRPGSSANYFLEGTIFGSLAIGLLIASATTNPMLKGVVWIVTFYLALTFPTRAALIAQSYGDPNAEDKIIDQIRALDLKGDQYILSDLEYTYAVYRAGKRPLLLDSFYYTLLVENGLINPATLYSYLKKEKVPYLVLHLPPDAYAALPYGYRGFPPELLTYLQQHYRCETRMKRWDGTLFVLCSQIPSTS